MTIRAAKQHISFVAKFVPYRAIRAAVKKTRPLRKIVPERASSLEPSNETSNSKPKRSNYESTVRGADKTC